MIKSIKSNSPTLRSQYQKENVFWLDVSGDIAMLILQKMADTKTSKKMLSTITGLSVRKLTKIVSGNYNLTIREILLIQNALNVVLIKVPDDIEDIPVNNKSTETPFVDLFRLLWGYEPLTNV
jgi:hypothetical protein